MNGNRDGYVSSAAMIRAVNELGKRPLVTYRQVDYWSRVGVLVPSIPANGSGSARHWSLDDVTLCRAMSILRRQHVPTVLLRELRYELDLRPELWDHTVVIDPDSMSVEVLQPGAAVNGWVIDLAGCRNHVLGSGMFPDVDGESVA